MRIINPGISGAVQDMGRSGFRAQGVPLSGAMDTLAHRLSNLLTGNNPNAATVELTLSGAALHFDAPALIAVCGGGASIFINNQPAPFYKTIWVNANATLHWRPHPAGARSYLAIAGGWDEPTVMYSRSAYPPAGFGAVLKAGDLLFPVKQETALQEKMKAALQNNNRGFVVANWSIPAAFTTTPNSQTRLRCMRGNEFHWLSQSAQENFFQQEFRIDASSNRMGYRLRGQALDMICKEELLSTAVLPGTLQRTPDGGLIVLMADAQTTGGYPRIAQVAAVDLPLCAQMPPGAQICFSEISHTAAEALFLKQETAIAQLQKNIALRFT
jgi:antagonist of KipI